ncbi:NAC domain [Arabidopsis thaliana x Arabidopsis arenosa]|uniref:NAC domain n=1 Tax=Arabidopsis thaliana x Arabidopsis arenosa TaxID=1240361 RepID=A0A8T1YV75_9BRAS|nr:NAC domain [Arabidopsis thaliana x Arabidopsis arenosa]KAG7550044.1 NAC domain [Arabidopsis thaliana x Arabidopsis arenosa]
MGKTQLAPGFRFHPTDVELVRYYLKRKVLGKKLLVDAIAEVDIYKFEPPDLPDMSFIRSGDLKWHFFCPREKKYASGVRANRATECGYWKTTGKERPVQCNSEVVGKIKTLVYHFGKSPRGERTDWVMHEYRLEDKVLTQMNVPQDTYVVCVLFKKDGPGPRNGAQYGAPFREEDWSDEEQRTDLPSTSNPTNLLEPSKETTLALTAPDDPIKDCFGGILSESCVSDFLPATSNTISELPRPSDAATTPMSTAPLAETLQTPNNDDLYSMLDLFDDDEEFLGFNNNEVRHDPGVSAPVCLEEEGIFNGLPELSNMPRTASYDLIENSELYLELQDLTAPLNPHIGLQDLTAPLNPQTGMQDLTAPLYPPTGNLNDPRSSSYLYNQGHFDFSAANDDDPYGFSASMGRRPKM